MPQPLLDRTDRAIVEHLQRDGRMANVELAEAVALSPSACLRRVRALEESGIIAGYRAEIDRVRAGLGLTVFVEMTVGVHTEGTAERVLGALTSLPEVVACYIISGEADILVELTVPDLASFERLLLESLMTIPDVVGTQSRFAIRTVRSAGPVPLEHWTARG